MKPLVRSAFAGLATGARSQSALAACARTPGRGGRFERFLNRRRVRKSLTRSAAFELVTDKLPVTPARTAPPSVGARITLGALTGALASSRAGGSGRRGAVVGALTSAAWTFAGPRYRSVAAARTGSDLPGAVLEDGAAVLLALGATRA
ncbi:MAG: DUF4126 domain-containing protein [Jatrophihabitans sp.]|uniref:DUF4126 domain-containing protein n=1 Tax=Jatrophihabitans sp. TaxID=1932789 RepID=UPI003911F95C